MSPIADKWRRVGAVGFVVAAALICWWPGFRLGFFTDDFVLLEGSLRAWRETSSAGEWLRRVFFGLGILDKNYRPLSTHLVFLTLHGLFGPDPRPFFALSLVSHIATSLMIGALGRRMGLGILAATLAGVFYATRDCLFGSVVWRAGIQDGLMTLFSTASMLALSWSVQSGRRRWAAISWALAACALLSKEMALVLPVLAIAVAWGAWPRSGWRQAARASGGHWALAFAYWALRFGIAGTDVGGYDIKIGPSTILRPGAYAFWTLVGWDPYGATWKAPPILLPIAGWGILELAVIHALRASRGRGRHHNRVAMAGLLWWAVGTLFVCAQRDRYFMYYLALPAGGAALLVGSVADRVAERMANRRRRWLTAAAAAGILTAAGWLMNDLKFDGRLLSGSFFNLEGARATEAFLDQIRRIAPGLQGRERVIFLGFKDRSYVLANTDGKGYRGIPSLASMLRASFDRLDLEVLIVVARPHDFGSLAVEGWIAEEEFRKDIPREGDLILSPTS